MGELPIDKAIVHDNVDVMAALDLFRDHVLKVDHDRRGFVPTGSTMLT